MQLLQVDVTTQVSCHNSISVQVLLQHCVLYYPHFYHDPESLSRQSLIVTELDFLLQLRSDVATWLLGVVNIYCRDPVFYVVTRLIFLMLDSLS